MSDGISVEETQENPQPKNALATLVNSTANFGSSGDGKKGGSSSFPWALIIAGVVALLMAIFGFTAVLARRKAAKLQHDLNVKEEKALQKKERAGQETRLVERAILEDEIADLEEEVEILRDKRAEVEKSRKTFEEKVMALTSWDDVEVMEAE